MKIFVYGTLMTGFSNYNQIKPYVESIENARAEGKLYDLGYFPAMVDGYADVRGQLFKIDAAHEEEALKRLDRLEGHPSLYRREKREVFIEETKELEEAWVYIYNNEISDDSRLIESGNWRKYSKLKGA